MGGHWDRALRGVVIGGDGRVRHALGGLLTAGGRVQVVEEAETQSEAWAVITRVCPDVVVIDLDRRDAESWLGVIESVRSECPAAAVVAVGASSRLAGPVIEAGADAFLSKLESPATLCDAVDAAVRQAEADRRGGRDPPPG